MRIKPFFVIISAASLISLAGFLSPLFAAPPAGPAAEIISVQGKGHFRENRQYRWKPAEVKQGLFAGNFVRTGSYARMGLLFRDQTQIRLNEKTILLVKKTRSIVNEKGTTLLRLNRGRVWTRSRTVPLGLIMETPSATAAIRGTSWEMTVDEDSTSILTVFKGEVVFYNDFGRIIVGQNEQARAELGKAPVKIVLVSPRDRVQWVTAYEVQPLRHVVFHSARLGELNQNLDQAKGNSVSERLIRGRILFDLGRWSEAESEFRTVLTRQPDNPWAIFGLGFAFLHKNEVDMADSYFGRVKSGGDGSLLELLRLGQAALMIKTEKLMLAVGNLKSLIQSSSLRQPAPYLLLSDIMIYRGDIPAAEKYVRNGLARFPESARLYAQLSRIYLFADRVADSAREAELALKKDPGSIESKLVSGDIAFIKGESEPAKRAFTEAARDNENEDRAWYGLGVINTEKEEVKTGRKNLARALTLNPNGPGYKGQLGTLETFANNFDDAEDSYRGALLLDPDDYVALTGLGLLKLKQGKTEAGLEAFLKAEILEPRYSRVQMYKGVAYYQLGRADEALEALTLAGELDEKDPMPHFMASIIYSDLLRANDAIDEARTALKLMPYLKSLNQLANDQRGVTNLGQAFATLGMEEWAKSYAHESYYPFWAGSHLFLADHYDGLFNKNSELFQGFLTDPTVFGASNRFQTLLPKPGHYLSGSLRGTTSEGFSGISPFLEVSGFDNRVVPFAYYLAYDNFDLEFDGLPFVRDTYTAALGLTPRHDLGVFVFADHSDLYNELLETSGSSVFDLEDTLATDRVDAGFHYKITPKSQVWFKGGYFQSEDEVAGAISGRITASFIDVWLDEYSLRHTFNTVSRHELTWGIDWAKRETESIFYLETSVGSGIYNYFEDTFLERSMDVYISDRFSVRDDLLIQVDLVHQWQNRKAFNDSYGWIPGSPLIPISFDVEEFPKSRVNPRLGLVYRFAPNRLVRLAYQDWIRPASFSTLGHVATAGIPLDDRLVLRGGELQRLRGQVEWELSPKSFASGYLDYKDINNNQFDIKPFTVNELESLGKLRQRDFMSLAQGDLLEFINTPNYESGKIRNAGVAFNHSPMVGWGVFGRYIYTSSENTGTTYKGKDVPYLPTHTGAVGATWVNPGGWYLVSRLVYRTERFTDEANTKPLNAGWNGAVDLYWESSKKNWLTRFSVDDMLDRDQDVQYTAEVNTRF